MKNGGVLLEMKNITKAFSGVRALDSASLCVRAGTVHALMGENGAGKSTLMKCLLGVYEKDSGSIFLNGEEVDFKNPRRAAESGVAMVQQELNQALNRSVAENMWMGRYPSKFSFSPFVSDGEARRKTREIFDSLGIEANPKEKMSRLSVSKRQMIEIAKAVSFGARVIVFDEPTSSLTEPEAERLFEIINSLKKQGCGIIYISHKMEEILRISDEITVMRDGKTVASRQAKEMSVSEIIRLMVGRELTNRYPPKLNEPGCEMLSVQNLSGEHSRLRNVSFNARQGEILGVAGLDGSGRTELLETIFGAQSASSGDIYLCGSRASNKNPAAAVKNGFALLTEERRANGIFGILGITENATATSLNRLGAGPFVSESRARRETDEIIKKLNVKAASRNIAISHLSGGNQQKVILGRWLLNDPAVLLLDEPTRGIDVGAKYEIYKIISRLAQSGKIIIMASSEMPELLGICNRILVMSGGRLAGEADAATATQEQIMSLAAKYV